MTNGSGGGGEEENGWDTEEAGEGWEVEEVREIATLRWEHWGNLLDVLVLDFHSFISIKTSLIDISGRVESKKAVEAKESLERELEEVRGQLGEVSGREELAREEAATLREVRDEVVRDRGDVQRRLDVLTEFFNKKEAELQKQLGLQSAK